MYKKDLKKYEAPVTEVISTELEGFVCQSGGSGNTGNSTNAEGISHDLDEGNFHFN